MEEENKKIETEENQEEKVEESKSEKKEEKKKESKPAVAKEKKKEKVETIELEREYVIPLRKGFLKVPKYKRAKKAIRLIREFLAKHMKVADRDLKLIKIDHYLNNEIWFRGIKKPANKIKVKAIKKGGVVYAELAEVPEVVKFRMDKDKKRKEISKNLKVKMPKHKEEEKEETAEEKTDEIEKEKATVEAGLELQKETAKEMKHTAKAETVAKEQQAIHKKATKK